MPVSWLCRVGGAQQWIPGTRAAGWEALSAVSVLDLVFFVGTHVKRLFWLSGECQACRQLSQLCKPCCWCRWLIPGASFCPWCISGCCCSLQHAMATCVGLKGSLLIHRINTTQLLAGARDQQCHTRSSLLLLCPVCCQTGGVRLRLTQLLGWRKICDLFSWSCTCVRWEEKENYVCLLLPVGSRGTAEAGRTSGHCLNQPPAQAGPPRELVGQECVQVAF